MNIEQTIYTILVADVTVASLVEDRVSSILLPQSTALPAISYQRVATTPQNGIEGHHGLDKVRVQVNSWALSFTEARTLAAAVRAAMALAPLNALLIMEIDDYDPGEKIYRVIQDYSIWS